MVLYISLLGIFLSLILLYYNAKKHSASTYLGIYFILVCFYGINTYVVLYSESVILVSIILTNFTFLHYLIGPASYLYIRSVLTNNARLKFKDLWHLIPMLIYQISVLPYVFSSHSTKVEVSKALIADRDLLCEYQFSMLSDFITTGGIYLSRPLLAFGYIIVAAVMFVRHKKLSANTNSQLINPIISKWLTALISFQILISLSHLLFLFDVFNMTESVVDLSEDVINIISSAVLIGLIILPILFPQILYGLHSLSTPCFSKEQTILVDSKSILTLKKNHLYEVTYMVYIHEKVDESLKNNQLFLQKDLNIPQLSVLINIPTHHLAYFFSGYLNKTFNEYRNVFRVEYAKQLITEQNSNHITLEAIGQLSGFSNRNAFSKVFKDLEGVNPSMYAARFK